MLPWLTMLAEFGSAEAMRSAVRARNPRFARERLQELAIVGAAEEGRRLVALCERSEIAVRAVVDDDPIKSGMAVGRCRVEPVESLTALDRSVPIVIASHRVLRVLDRLRGLGFSAVAPFALLQVLDPRTFPPHLFYDGWLEELHGSRERYRLLGHELGDDTSRAVLDAIVGFRLTLDAAILAPIVDWDLYGASGLLTYREDDVYVDGGSYDGDTVRLFIERAGGRFSRILAFEPDRSSFERLQANFADEKRVEPINAGLHRRTATMHFDNAGTRGSTLVDDGGIDIRVVGLDEVLAGDRVTVIKMNIEGAELEALHGATQAIRRWRPTLVISAYHRPSHLWEVPAVIRTIDSDYALFLRQHDGGVIETVVYGLPKERS